jgi:hypothetical protein
LSQAGGDNDSSFMADQLSLKRLLTLLESPSESAALDFKETLDLNHPRDRVEFTKDVLAMANTGGGHIVVGVEDSTRKHVGLNEAALSSLCEAKTVNDKIRKYTGGYVTVSVAQHTLTTDNAANTLVLIYVPPASSKIPAQDDGIYPEPTNPSKQRWTFRKGDVYVRKADESVKVETPADLWAAPTLGDHATASAVIEAYVKRFADALTHELPPILQNETAEEVCGQNLIQMLSGPRDYLVLGPSGLGKSIHLKHFCLSALHRKELPLLGYCKHYRGGSLLDRLDHEANRFSTAGAKTLLEAAEIQGYSTVLVVDGLNETQPFLEDLLSEIQAFKLRFSLKVILSSQTDNLPQGSFNPERVALSPLSKEHKRFIYCHNAQIPPSYKVDHLCEGFSNGYDLALAGRCHKPGAEGPTRVELYERYCRRSLPTNTTVSEALARALAARMADELSTFLPRDDFERYSEEFLASQNASLTLLDQLKASRLVSLTDDTFAFEHDLLLDYLRAEQVRREGPVLNLSELGKPKNQSLIPLLLPRYSEDKAVRSLLGIVSNPAIFREILAGHCGAAAREVLLADCIGLIDTASSDLPNAELSLPDEKFEGALPLFVVQVTGRRSWSEYEVRLCDVIAVGLEIAPLQERFLEILDLTQWTLRAKAKTAAEQRGISFGALWQIIVGQLGIMGNQELFVYRVASRLREITMREQRRTGFFLQEKLWERIRSNSNDHFSISILLESLSSCWPDTRFMDTYVELARIAWTTKIYHLRLNALHLLEQSAWHFEKHHPDQIGAIRTLLSGFKTNNILLNSALLETQVRYGAIHPVLADGQATDEMRSLLDESSKAGSDNQSHLHDLAYGLIGNMFEDIFEGAYIEAFDALSPTEQVSLLCLAAKSERSGFYSGWILHRLLDSDDPAALPVFELYASRIDAESSSPQHSAAAFAIGVAGCARLRYQPPSFSGPATHDHAAWRIIGQILFWTLRAQSTNSLDHDQISKLWIQLRNEAPFAGADALYRLVNGLQLVLEETEVRSFDLASKWDAEAEPFLQESLKNRTRLTSLFGFGGSKDAGLVKYLIDSLGRIASKSSIPFLKEVSDDPQYGEAAIIAIQKIQKSGLL